MKAFSKVRTSSIFFLICLVILVLAQMIDSQHQVREAMMDADYAGLEYCHAVEWRSVVDKAYRQGLHDGMALERPERKEHAHRTQNIVGGSNVNVHLVARSSALAPSPVR